MTVAIIELKVRPELFDQAVEAIRGSLQTTRDFAGCEGVELLLSADDDLVLLFERWESAAHRQKYAAWRAGPGADASIVSYFAGPPVVRVFESHG